jgi:hypothetical protein
MKRSITLALFTAVSALALGVQDPATDARLLRTVQLGVPQDTTAGEIRTIVQDPKTSFLRLHLARSALLVLQQDDDHGESFESLLSRVLNTPLASGNEYPGDAGIPPGFGGKELVFTMVYAMVMSGKQERAVDILEQQLFTGSQFKQAVVLQALRNVGTQRAKGLVQKYQERGDFHNVAENTLVDEDLPVLHEIHDRWNLIPPPARKRNNLLNIIRGGCGEREAMAAYWLGYFGADPDPAQEQAEISALKALYDNDSPKCDFMARVIAMKALGLRSAQSVDYWANLMHKEPQIWLRHQIVINGFARFGRRFAPAALEWLSVEPTQYIQWQLMQGNMECRLGQHFREYWDMWIPVTLQFLLVFPDPGHREPMPAADQDQLLRWLEAGHHPQDRVVLNHMLYNLMPETRRRNTRRLLTIFHRLPDRNKNWWILTPLEDASALPLLRYYSGLPSPGDQHQQLAALVDKLQRSPTSGGTAKPDTCCDPTAACLRSMLSEQTEAGAKIGSEQSAQAWLAASASGPAYRISFSGPLLRTATVHRAGQRDQHWEYLYDCWRRTDRSESGTPRAAR